MDVQANTASLIDGDAIDARSRKPLAAGTQALPVDTNPEPLTLPVGEKQPRTSQPQGTRNEGMPTIPKRIDTRKGDRHRPGYWRDYFRARKAKLKAEREEN